MDHVHICGESSDLWLGVPPPKAPHCENGHRRIVMRWRVRKHGFLCRHCGHVMSEGENLQAVHNTWWRERSARLDQRMREELQVEA